MKLAVYLDIIHIKVVIQVLNPLANYGIIVVPGPMNMPHPTVHLDSTVTQTRQNLQPQALDLNAEVTAEPGLTENKRVLRYDTLWPLKDWMERHNSTDFFRGVLIEAIPEVGALVAEGLAIDWSSEWLTDSNYMQVTARVLVPESTLTWLLIKYPDNRSDHWID